MCGIAGILVRDSQLDSLDAQQSVQSMAESLAHRGPDDGGVAQVDMGDGWRLHLGHRRLSIIDVSRNGHQPMEDPESGSWLCYNGEIYNHIALRGSLPASEFRSSSDTETLLKAWVQRGPEVLHELRGMFAFALFDARRRQFWLVRDRLGIKPLYVASPRPGLLLFASEVRALLASELIPRKMSPAGLRSYLAFGSVQAPFTMVESIRSLLPGERLKFECSGGELPAESSERYWQLPFAEAAPGAVGLRNGHRSALIEQLRPRFDESVKSRFLADVPVGVFLSGGIDSSAIVASAARQQLEPETFSISFAETEFDESHYAKLVAQACGVKHTVLNVTAGQMLRELETAFDAYDQPSSDGLNTYTISNAARQAGLKVAISGLGGDEGFAGYPSFRRLKSLERWLPTGVSLGGLRSIAAELCPDTRTLWRRIQLLMFAPTRLDRYSVLRQFFSAERIGRLTGEPCVSANILGSELRDRLRDQAAATDPVNAASLLELSLYLHNTLLRDTDQMSMAHGLEVRVPLIDHLLIEELARIDGLSKLPGRGEPNKWLLVELVRKELPREAIFRKKMGFVFPWGEWLRGELSGFVEQHLRDNEAVAAAGLVPSEVSRLWDGYRRGKSGVRYSELLALLNLVRWCQVNRVSAA